jgi:riboflavin biosynthesis pyrimidine reductase
MQKAVSRQMCYRGKAGIMNLSVTRLFPAHQRDLALEGLYLEHDLHTKGRSGKPYVYSNFISSLDGRIAIADAAHTTHVVPAACANPRDWRLYQELAGQADLLVTSGRYFRQSLLGEAQDELPLGSAQKFDDIREWRATRGLLPQPDIAIMSSSLNIPLAALEQYRTRRIHVVTGEDADPGRVAAMQENDINVIRAGSGIKVNGRKMIDELAQHGYRSIYAIAGPAVFHTLLASRVVDRLYLTITQQILGGDNYDTLSRGNPLQPAQGMQLVGLCHDPHAPADAGQLFGVFEPGKQPPDPFPGPKDHYTP